MEIYGKYSRHSSIRGDEVGERGLVWCSMVLLEYIVFRDGRFYIVSPILCKSRIISQVSSWTWSHCRRLLSVGSWSVWPGGEPDGHFLKSSRVTPLIRTTKVGRVHGSLWLRHFRFNFGNRSSIVTSTYVHGLRIINCVICLVDIDFSTLWSSF